MQTLTLKPIGFVRGGRSQPIDDDWGGVAARIALDPEQFDESALEGLDAFSHLELIYAFHAAREDKTERGARHPRGRADWPKVGIFAQRGKDRPNHLGLSVCKLVRVEGLEVHVLGLDAIDGSPVLDLKPYMRGFAPRGEVVEPAWAAELMAGYW